MGLKKKNHILVIWWKGNFYFLREITWIHFQLVQQIFRVEHGLKLVHEIFHGVHLAMPVYSNLAEKVKNLNIFLFFMNFFMSTYSKTLNIFKIPTKSWIYPWRLPTGSYWCYRLSWSGGSRWTPSWSSYWQKSKSATFFFNIALIPTKYVKKWLKFQNSNR